MLLPRFKSKVSARQTINEEVREAVAKRGRDKDLDILVDDENLIVRQAVADQGRPQDLYQLAHDPEETVRQAVSWQGYKDVDFPC